MKKDLKEKLNTVEEETKSHAELEASINSLKEEINRLNGIIDEQKTLIDENSDSIISDDNTIPSEIGILKDLIISQRQKLIKKDETNEMLQDKISDLVLKSKSSKDGTLHKEANEDLIEAQELVLAFTEESKNFRKQIKELESQISSMKSGKSEFDVTNQEEMGESEEVVNIKRLNFQLMEENGLLRVENESLKVKLQKQIVEMNSEELTLSYQKIETLTLELDDYEAQVQYLQQKLGEEGSASESQPYPTDELNKLKEELSRYQYENQRLNNILLELNHSNKSRLSENDDKSVVFNFPNQFQITLFKRLYNLLDDIDKKAVINSLIKDLDNRNHDVKRVVLKILSGIRDEKVYEAFFDLLHDEDWVIRYKAIKTLTNFGFDNKGFKDLLKKLISDTDVDVRELALKVLGDMA